MVRRWTLDDTSNGLVDLVGGLALTPGGTPTTAAGVISNANHFDGASWLGAAHHEDFTQRPGTAYEVWFRTSNEDNNYRVIVSHENAADRNLSLYKIADRVEVYAFGAASTSVYLTGLFGAWNHLAVVLGADNKLRVYLNGGTPAEADFAGPPNAYSVPLGIGGRFNELSAGWEIFFDGDIDEVAIWQFGPAGDPGTPFWLNRCNAGAGRRP